MKRSLINFFPLVLFFVMTAFWAGCDKSKDQDADNALSESLGGMNGTYWKAVDTSGYIADIFLWEGGKAYFRFIQGSGDENDVGSLYAFRDTFSCNWILEGSALKLTSGSGEIIYQGTITGNRLTVPYDDMDVDSIIFEQAPMPPYGAQWSMADWYDTSWRMVSYTDSNGTAVFDNGIFSAGNKDEGRYVYSDIWVQSTYLVDFNLTAFAGSKKKGFEEKLSELSINRANGALWDDCPNKAWYAELKGGGGSRQRIGITYADGKLFVKKGDGRGVFPDSFTAVYEYLGINRGGDEHEWEDWLGDYYFEEFAPPNQNMDYRISVTNEPDWDYTSAFIQIDGFRTMARKQGWVFGNPNHIEIVYSDPGNDDMDEQTGNQYRYGEIIVSFTRKSGGLYTTWYRLRPMLPANKAPGVYFEKK